MLQIVAVTPRTLCPVTRSRGTVPVKRGGRELPVLPTSMNVLTPQYVRQILSVATRRGPIPATALLAILWLEGCVWVRWNTSTLLKYFE